MNILSFNTCFNKCSAAVLRSDKISATCSLDEPNRQAEMLISLIDEVLEKSNLQLQDVHYIVTTNGPGTFTGVRIGLACAQGLNIGTKAKVSCISTLSVVWHAYGMRKCCVVFKAARGRFYAQKFNENGAEFAPELVMENRLEAFTHGYTVVGDAHSAKELIMPNAELLAIACNEFLQQEGYNQLLQHTITPLYIGKPDAYG